jgi:hypothetical protein
MRANQLQQHQQHQQRQQRQQLLVAGGSTQKPAGRNATTSHKLQATRRLLHYLHWRHWRLAAGGGCLLPPACCCCLAAGGKNKNGKTPQATSNALPDAHQLCSARVTYKGNITSKRKN